MIQRIQTLWLLLASLCMFLSLKMPFYSGNRQAGENANTFLSGTENLPLMFLTLAIGILALVNIFLYTNRKMQFILCLAAMALQVLLFILYIQAKGNFINETGTYSLTSLLQPATLFFLLLAARGIMRDNKIIRESERLR